MTAPDARDAPDDAARPPWWRTAEPGRRLAGKRAVVTGAGTDPTGGPVGIGEAIAVLFAAQGARVAIADVAAERAAATLRMVEAVGGEAVCTIGDLADVEANARCIGEAADALGGLDTVVNSVAVTCGAGSPVDLDLAEWDRAMRLNLGAAVLTVRHALPHLRAANGGSILNISSIAATRGHGSGAYAASKAALGGLTRDWAYLHGREGIRVNEILIGHVFSPMGDQGGPEIRARRLRAGLLPTEGLAWDVAWPAVFLASEEARWITGVDLPVDAGTTSTGPYAMSLLDDGRTGYSPPRSRAAGEPTPNQ